MKGFVTIAICLLAGQLFSQNVAVPEPEFYGAIYNVKDSTLIKLESQVSVSYKSKNDASYIPAVGVYAGKATIKNSVDGAHSPVQIDKKPKAYFILRVKDNSVDPSSEINIFQLTPINNARTIEVGTLKTYDNKKTDEMKFIPFNYKKYGQSSYLIELENLESGEYAMTLPERRDLFHMFGVK